MSEVGIIPAPDLTGCRTTPVLTEDRIGHYPEFRAFLADSFDLDRVGLAVPGAVRAPSGGVYLLVFLGRSGESFPSGVEIQAVVPALEPLEDVTVDEDLWAILRWLVAGVGGAWRVEDLDATGRLYRIPAAR